MTPAEQHAQDRMARAALLADWYAVSTIESECDVQRTATGRWYDTRSLLSLDEQPAEWADVNAACVQHALDRRLIERDPARPHWVRVVRQPANPPAAWRHAAPATC